MIVFNRIVYIHWWLFDGRRSFDRYLILFLTHPISMHLFDFVLKVSKAYSYTSLLAICFSLVCQSNKSLYYQINQQIVLASQMNHTIVQFGRVPISFLQSSSVFLSLSLSQPFLTFCLFMFGWLVRKSLFAIVYSGLLSGWSIQTIRGFCWSISSATWRSQHKRPQYVSSKTQTFRSGKTKSKAKRRKT